MAFHCSQVGSYLGAWVPIENELGAVVVNQNSCADIEQCMVYPRGRVQPGVLQVALDLPAVTSVK